jgi:4-hydroxy-tetrahydrodipicolinate reductase
LTDNLAAALRDGDVLVDFTAAEALPGHLDRCVAAGRAMVVGTTGLDAAGKAAIAAAATRIPVVHSANMSVGVNALAGLLQTAARALGAEYDVEIIEAHHNKKRDSPSGTALLLRDAVARGRGLDPEKASVYGRHGMVGPRPEGEIGIHAVRGGDIVGDHTVLFAGPGERLEFVHRAHSRENFAKGAVLAAVWVLGRSPGLYSMQDVLGLRPSGEAG